MTGDLSTAERNKKLLTQIIEADLEVDERTFRQIKIEDIADFCARFDYVYKAAAWEHPEIPSLDCQEITIAKGNNVFKLRFDWTNGEFISGEYIKALFSYEEFLRESFN